MLEEIARKQVEAQAARLEEARRASSPASPQAPDAHATKRPE